MYTPTDTELWELVKQDNREAFELLYRRHMRALYAAIYKWALSKADAEDILQEVFLDVWEKRQSINIGQHIFNYLYSITRYKVFDYIKNRKLSSRHLEAWAELTSMLNQPVQLPETSNPVASLLDAEVAQLPPQMKRVYQLRFRDEKSIRDIADELLVSPSTVKNQLQQIRKRLHHLVSGLSSIFISLLGFAVFIIPILPKG